LARGEDAKPPQVTVESWVIEVSLAEKSRDVGGRSMGDLFSIGTTKLNSLAELGLTANQLVDELKSKKLGHVLTNSKLRLPSGQQGSLQVNGTTIGATATVNGEKIRLDYRVDITEEDPKLRDTVTGVPGYRQWTAHSGFELESGKAAMLSSLLPVPGKLPRGMAVIVQATVAASPQPKSGEVRPAAAPSGEKREAAVSSTTPVPLTVGLKVMQIEVAKLKRLGFSWSQLGPAGEQTTAIDSVRTIFNFKGSPEQLEGFIEALRKNGLARVIAEPTLVTLDGRPAQFNAGQTTIEFVPILLASGRVKLECRLKSGDSPELLASDELDLGKMCLVRDAKLHDPRQSPQSPGTELLVLARVDLLKSGQIPNIAGPLTYIEVQASSK
jgi:hypothetical protein